MKKLFIALTGLALSNIALADAGSFVEIAGITAGQTNGNSNAGVEVAGAWAITDMWYIGGKVGSYTAEGVNDLDNDYLNINGGAAVGITESTDFILEVGYWMGEQDGNTGPASETDPKAFEFKTGVKTSVADNFDLFATIGLIYADDDTAGDSDQGDYVLALGGSYSFTDNLYVSVQSVRGGNFVNGQTDVYRMGVGWSF